ncbi:hypothetical protein HS041_26080 [Planomonospora sp. ID67723]|uniref:hypothetical protein n=1 Tax=Planomonospora sp. ID67723 TaxID=2738134 RepID=UPI0018C409B8|nr:hypothetical protein [Planomonospora sp. ID67723]MBG0831226.1 hypothetical protein [Planomonospora sp. ID67723]
MPGKGNYESISDGAPLVRLVRLPADDFDSGLVPSLYGKVLRWGPGWWIRHPGANGSAETLAIAAQLRAVEADPGSGLR